MKKFLALAGLFIVVLSLVGCGSNSYLVGSWNNTGSHMEALRSITFNRNGTGEAFFRADGGLPASFTWEILGGQVVTLSFDSGGTTTYTIFWPNPSSSNEVQLSQMTFRRN